MRIRIVCPVSCAYEGDAAFVSIPSTDGEFGVLPAHSSEICTIDRGYVRVSDKAMGTVDHTFAVAGGYVQVADDVVTVLAERACDLVTVYHYAVSDTVQLTAGAESFQHILVTDGNGTIDGRLLQKGDSFLVPAGYGNFSVSGQLEMLVTSI